MTIMIHDGGGGDDHNDDDSQCYIVKNSVSYSQDL